MKYAFNVLLDISMSQLANLFTVGSIVACLLVVPFSVFALFWKRNDPAIVEARHNTRAKYWPSLFITRFLTWANAIALALIIPTAALRIYLHYEPPAGALRQPLWSYIVSMFNTTVIVAILYLPSIFHLWVKERIVHIFERENGTSEVGSKERE